MRRVTLAHVRAEQKKSYRKYKKISARFKASCLRFMKEWHWSDWVGVAFEDVDKELRFIAKLEAEREIWSRTPMYTFDAAMRPLDPYHHDHYFPEEQSDKEWIESLQLTDKFLFVYLGIDDAETCAEIRSCCEHGNVRAARKILKQIIDSEDIDT